MDDFFKYVTKSDIDENWGITITVAGCTHILPNTPYPNLSHPEDYRFSPEKTRKVAEYQLVYITTGEGYFESEHTKKQRIKPGNIIILFPGELHRYHPSKKIGWTEYYVGFNGLHIDSLAKEGFLKPSDPILDIGLHEKIVQLFDEIIALIKDEKKGYQQYATGIVLHLIGELLFHKKNRSVSSDVEQLISATKIYISENYSEKIDWHKLSRAHFISYSKFRKEFKEYVGISPGQYQLQVKINKAKALLSQSTKPIKDVSETLGFQNVHYFNTIFKQKTGISPGKYRKTASDNLVEINKTSPKDGF